MCIKWKWKSLSHVQLFATPWTIQHSPWNSPGQNMGEGSLLLLQGIFPTQESNPGLPHCRKILCQLSHQRSPRILEWVAYPSPMDLPDPGIEPGSPALQVDSLPTELSGKPVSKVMSLLFNMLSMFVIAFLPRSNCLLISCSHHLQWFWSPWQTPWHSVTFHW